MQSGFWPSLLQHTALGTPAPDYCCGVLAAAGTAKLHEAYSSQPQQVARSLEAALRYTLREQHTLQDSNDRISMLVKATGTCARRCPGSSSSSSAGSSTNSPAAKQLFSLLVTCLKAASQWIFDSSSSSSNGGSQTSDVDTKGVVTLLADHLGSQELCLQIMDGFHYFNGSLQLLLQGRCLLHLASSAI
jgi:hypothetical protein